MPARRIYCVVLDHSREDKGAAHSVREMEVAAELMSESVPNA